MPSRRIEVSELARVEGLGSLLVQLLKGAPQARFGIFEPPRLFEGFLRGRKFDEAPDITSRICGICPVAYQLTACQAMEQALGVEIDLGVQRLRRLLYCGEWMESHGLHVFMLHGPDFFGRPDAFAVAREHPELVTNGLRIKKAGNEIIRVLGGREIHPVNVRVGGFFRAPSRAELLPLVAELRICAALAGELLPRLAELAVPEFDRPYEFFSLRGAGEYPMSEGRLVSSGGLDIAAAEYEQHFVEEQVPHSTALHSHGEGGRLVFSGPLARFNLSFELLNERTRAAAASVGLVPPVLNPFRSLLVRLLEIMQAAEEAASIIERYEQPARAFTPLAPRAGTGCGCTEAPRGSLYHRYVIDERGLIEEAEIVPPTCRNLAVIESDLRELAPRLAALSHTEATRLAEQAVRNYDPCISCATH